MRSSGYAEIGISFLFSVPQPVILFPLNAEYQTSDIKNRTAPGIPRGVSLAPGPYGEEDGSYEFFGNVNSFIEFPNSPGGALDVRYSMTILCWVYYDEKGGPRGPIFDYRTGGKRGVHLWVYNGLFYGRFNDRDYSWKPVLWHTSLADGWKFVGASYDNETGEIRLWVDGTLKQSRNMGAGVELGTQDDVQMGVSKNDNQCLKGRLAQLQIYDVALSQQQILELRKKLEGEKSVVECHNLATSKKKAVRDQVLYWKWASIVFLLIAKYVEVDGVTTVPHRTLSMEQGTPDIFPLNAHHASPPMTLSRDLRPARQGSLLI